MEAGAEGATENTAVVQALLDNLIGRGLDPNVPRLSIVDGAKALSKAVRNTFGVATAIQGCQAHKGCNTIERLPDHLHAGVKKALRQAWALNGAKKAETLPRNLARRLEHEAPGVSGSILEGMDEILPPTALGAPPVLGRRQHHRERHRHGPAGQPQRQALVLGRDGAGLERRRHGGSPKGLPATEDLPEVANPAHGPGETYAQGLSWQRP